MFTFADASTASAFETKIALVGDLFQRLGTLLLCVGYEAATRCATRNSCASELVYPGPYHVVSKYVVPTQDDGFRSADSGGSFIVYDATVSI